MGHTACLSSHHLLLLTINTLDAVIRFQLPRGHMSNPGSSCNRPALSYKRMGQTPISKELWRASSIPGLNNIHTSIVQLSRGHRILRSGGPNHINRRVHRVFSIARTQEN
jgi:hypothetical protein